MNTKESNKLIAEFMAKLGDWRAKNLLCGGFGVKCLSHYGNYHDSWDWLMPVFSKIQNICGEYYMPCEILSNGVSIGNKVTGHEIAGGLNIYEPCKNGLFDAVYKILIKFITWYNEQA